MIAFQNRNIKKKFGKRVAIFGSTGSIGCSTLEICRRYSNEFEVYALVAGNNKEKLLAQILEFNPSYAVLTQVEGKSETLCNGTELRYGQSALKDLASYDFDIMVAAIVGIAGLESVLTAIECGRDIALANKESLVCAGELISERLLSSSSRIIPVDSEHSSIFRCLEGKKSCDIISVILTASGGPFLHRPIDTWDSITPEEAVKHPRWTMGKKISIDSATMMNKALEVIEARWLFGFENIKVLIHPESIVHGLIELVDGTIFGHMACADMKAPIAYALKGGFETLPDVVGKLSLEKLACLHFYPLDENKFPAVSLAFECLNRGKAAPAVLNIANECAVRLFLSGRIKFPDIYRVVKNEVENLGATAFSGLEDLKLLQSNITDHLMGFYK